MRRYFLSMASMVALICCLMYASDAVARGVSAVDLNLIPTAKTVGKGGYSLSVGTLPYDVEKHTREPMEVAVGEFLKEKHDVELQSDIWLTPIRITYGISERLDFTFGTTYSSGDTDKSVNDFYETGDDSIRRTYSQEVLDGVLGMKYILQEAVGGMPALAIGGEIQGGYTVDEELTDETPRDSLPFVATQIYMSASYDFEIASIHGGAGIFLSSKSIDSDDKVELPLQGGLELPFDALTVTVDVALFRAFSDIDRGTTVSGGLRYDLSPRSAVNASIASDGGFLVRFTVSGRQPVITEPPPAPIAF